VLTGKSVVPFLLSVLFTFAVVSAKPDTCSMAQQDSCHQQMWKQLNLTPDQATKLKSFKEEMKTFRKTSMEKMADLRKKSKDELLKAVPDKTVLQGYAKELGDLHKTMAEQMADHMLKIKTILTKEQFEKLLSKDFMMNMRQKMGECKKDGKGCKGMMHGMDD
jgi:Spy/CpxP family protein refolding chaperone